LEQHKELPRLERYEILDRIERIEGRNIIRDKAFVAFLFLSACRVEEVVTYYREKVLLKAKRRAEDQYKGKDQMRVVLGQPIRKKQVDIVDDSIIIHGVRTLKRRDEHRRSIPILMNDREMPFIEIFMRYLNSLEPEDYLFQFNRTRGYQILSSVGLFCHYMRHLRNTILSTEYNFTGQQMQQFNGWTKSGSADPYVHLGVEDLLAKMRK
jgi:integrase